MKILFLFTILIASLAQNLAAQDSVSVSFKVVVPEVTPPNGQIFWAGSLNRWDPGVQGQGMSAKDHSRLLSFGGDSWSINIKAPKNEEVFYKYTRGSIYSVEENADYSYKELRKVIFDEDKTIQDTVAAWHDLPPKSLVEQWPRVGLQRVNMPITYNGKEMDGFGTLLYDRTMGKRFFDTKTFNTEICSIPDQIYTHVPYFLKISNAPDNTILALAGIFSENDLWKVYLDQNNDNSIDSGELIFTIESDTVEYSWRGDILIQRMRDDKPVNKTVNIKINHGPDIPTGYRSSTTPGAPNLTYKLPFRQRVGNLHGNDFYLNSQPELNFLKYFQLLVDRDRNDTLEIASGSQEIYEYGTVDRSGKYYPFPSFKLADRFWNVANIDSEGRWVRLRPALNVEENEQIVKGKMAPTYTAITTAGRQTSSKSLRGKYVLLNFWGSWCGPCIEEIPVLKKVYQRFKSDSFEMVGFAYENKTSLEKALKKYQLPWLNVLDDQGKYSSKFLVRGYPTHYLIGPDGTLVEMGNALRGEQLIQTLEKYLNK